MVLKTLSSQGKGGRGFLSLCDFFSLVSSLFLSAWEAERRKRLRDFAYFLPGRERREREVVRLTRGRVGREGVERWGQGGVRLGSVL